METITGRRNSKIVHLRRLGSDRKYRYEHREFLCDGEKLLGEAVSNGAKILTVLTSGREDINITGAEVYSVSRDLIDCFSPLKTAQSIVFSCRRPEITAFPSCGVILENIQDPGNVGTVLRTANAFGIESVMLLGECADLYNPKTIRAGMGAVFRQRAFTIGYDDVRELKERGVKVYGAAFGDDCVPLDKADLRGCALVIGNEGSGITDGLLDLCDGKITIPMAPECESLNAAAAAAVIMWEMRNI